MAKQCARQVEYLQASTAPLTRPHTRFYYNSGPALCTVILTRSVLRSDGVT